MSMTTSVKNNFMHPSLMSNLQGVLSNRKESCSDPELKTEKLEQATPQTGSRQVSEEQATAKPVVLLTNGDGIEAPGLAFLIDALVRDEQCNVYVCAPESDKSVSGHSVTVGETLAVTSKEIKGVKGYGISGSTADCVSLALSGVLFSPKPALVVSGINQGLSCGHHTFYSGSVAGAREALISGVPSLSISLNWKKDESSDDNFREAATVCLPLIRAALFDVGRGRFPKDCFLNIEIPTFPSTNKGFKVTKRSMWRYTPKWQIMPARAPPSSGNFMSKQQSLGIQLAQLSRDASAAGAARRLNLQKKTVEIESVAEAVKPESPRATKMYFRMEFLDAKYADADEDLDFNAVEHGFVTITPLGLCPSLEKDIRTSASQWLTAALL